MFWADENNRCTLLIATPPDSRVGLRNTAEPFQGWVKPAPLGLPVQDGSPPTESQHMWRTRSRANYPLEPGSIKGGVAFWTISGLFVFGNPLVSWQRPHLTWDSQRGGILTQWFQAERGAEGRTWGEQRPWGRADHEPPWLRAESWRSQSRRSTGKNGAASPSEIAALCQPLSTGYKTGLKANDSWHLDGSIRQKRKRFSDTRGLSLGTQSCHMRFSIMNNRNQAWVT